MAIRSSWNIIKGALENKNSDPSIKIPFSSRYDPRGHIEPDKLNVIDQYRGSNIVQNSEPVLRTETEEG